MRQLSLLAILMGITAAPVATQGFVVGGEWNWQAAVTGPGGLYSLNLQVRATQGSPALEMGSCPEGAEAEGAHPWWRWQIPADGKTHRVEMVLDLPRGMRLGLRLAGEGQATVEALRLQAVTKEPSYVDKVLTGVRAAERPESLPEGWEPEGTLDARTREIGEGVELVVDVGGLTLSSPAEITVAQGYRAGPPVYISNPGDVEKSLKIVVQGPEGSLMPSYAIPIAPRGTTAFTPPLQLMRVGSWWVKYTFSVGEEAASLPLKVQVRRAYPALMVDMVKPEGLPGLVRDLPYAQIWVLPEAAHGPEQSLGVDFSRPEGVTETVRKLNPPLLQLVGAPGPAGAGAPPSAESLAAQTIQAYEKIYKDILPLGADTAAVSPAWTVTPSEQGLQASALMKLAFEGGLGKYVQSVGVGVDILPSSGPILEKTDGKAPPGNIFWQGFLRTYDFTGLRQFLANNEAALPLLLDLTERHHLGGGNRLAALALARLMLEATWQGGTGTVLNLGAELEGEGTPREPEFLMVRELWRELAGAGPLYGPTLEDGSCSHSPEAPVTYWSFLRGNEGIVFLANNSSTPQELAAEVRGEPVQMQVLRLNAFGEPVTRQIQDVFRFSEEANERRQQAIYLRLAPGEMVGIALLIRGVGPGWLRSLGRRPAPLRKPGDQGAIFNVPQGDPWTSPGIKW